MKTLVSAGFCLVVLGQSVVWAQDKPPVAAQERIELAKRIYRERILFGLERRVDPPHAPSQQTADPLLNETMAEDLHRWSVRWMEAESDFATDKVGRVAAAQAHLDRMKSVESGKMVRKELAAHPFVKELDEKKILVVDIDVDQMRVVWDELPVATRRYPDVARYFRLEAEARLVREQAGR